MTHPSAMAQRWLDVEDAGVYIGVVKVISGDPDPGRTRRRQKQQMYTMVYRGTIPYHKRGKRVFFDRDELDQWMRSGAH